MFGAIEAGGTKFVCGVGTGPGDLLTERFETTHPEETIGKALEFFGRFPGLQAMGIASFGPVDLDRRSATYGYITTTPKRLWNHFNFVGGMEKALGVPVGFDTDVNAAALAEVRWGAGRGRDTLLTLPIRS